MIDLIKKSMSTATSLISEGRLEESEAICRQVLRVDADNPDAMCLLSFCMKRSGKEEEASELRGRAASIMGCESKVLNHLGISCMHARDLKSAHEHFALASEINTSDSDAPFNAGSCALMEGRPKYALSLFRESYARSKSHKSMIGMSCAKTEMMDLEGSIELLLMVLRDDPSNWEARTNMATALHLSGRWEEAWSYYPSRFMHYERLRKASESLGLPVWREGSIPKGRILVFAEQGIGDIINFGRMSLCLQEKYPDRHVRTLLPSQLRALVESQGVTTTECKENFDVCCSMMDIPGLLGLSMDEVRNSFVPMKASKICEMSRFKDLFKVGVCWAGNPAHPKDHQRSCSLANFREISELKGVKLFNLQKDLRPRIWPHSTEPVNLSAGCEGMKLVNMSPHMNSWEDTAAIISSLDLVISVDTSVMHLSASIGKETWGLIPYMPDWRWGLNSESSCWYPELRLFRQKDRGCWESVFSAVCDELKRKLASRLDR
jgi:Flp pilus assembly protein TadD